MNNVWFDWDNLCDDIFLSEDGQPKRKDERSNYHARVRANLEHHFQKLKNMKSTFRKNTHLFVIRRHHELSVITVLDVLISQQRHHLQDRQ